MRRRNPTRSRSAFSARPRPGEPSHWERHRVTYEPNLNVISVLQKIAAQATTADGQATTPVAWDCNCLEEVCGACTMLVNGKTRQACSALVDRLLEDDPDGIELRPMSKFPVLRDLCVDRRRMFRALEKLQGVGRGGRLLRPRPRPEGIAGEPGAALPAVGVHDAAAAASRPARSTSRSRSSGGPARATRSSRRGRTRRTTRASSAPRRSARRCCSTTTPPAR